MKTRPKDELRLACCLLMEATGCDPAIAADVVDSIARYTSLKMQDCLPAGWGQRG